MTSARLRASTSIAVMTGRASAWPSLGYGVVRSWLYALLKRYRAEGNASFKSTA
jgi:hypothetical protein